MAGIGFALRKHLRQETFSGLLRGYGYAGLISSGSWVCSIVGIMAMGELALYQGLADQQVRQFYVSVTYLMAASLIVSGGFQLMFTRFIADRLFEKRPGAIIPNLLGALATIAVISGGIGTAVLWAFFDQPLVYRICMLANFVTLCCMWIVVALLSGLKAYRAVLAIIFCGYALAVVLAGALSGLGLGGMLAALLAAHAFMVFAFLTLLVRNYPPEDRIVSLDFLSPRKAFYVLMLIGLLNNLGIWVDKIAFWFNPLTSDPVIGPLRASLIYDLPIFLAYLSIVPGMGVFLVRVETDFAEHYEAFYDAVREGGSLGHIQRLKDQMTFSVRQGIYEIFKIQGLTVAILLLAGERILSFIGISVLYLPLFHIDAVAVGVQVLLMATLNALFYLDRRTTALLLNVLFVAANLTLTLWTQSIGAAFFGYGFALSLLITFFVGIVLLSGKLDLLEYETFMLQR